MVVVRRRGRKPKGAKKQAPRVEKVTYNPHYWQWRFHQSKARDRALIAGIRGGKTVAGAMEFLRLLTEGPVGVGLISGPDLPTLKASTMHTMIYGIGPELLGRWPEAIIRDFHRTDNIITLVDGNQALIRSSDDPDNLRGPAAKCVWLDECTLCKNEVLPILQGRTLDTKGRLIATGTPKGKRNWIYTDVLQNCQEVEPGRVWKGDRWEVFRYPSKENPGLDPYEIEKLGQQYSAQMRAQELEAEMVDWGGAVFLVDALNKCTGLYCSHWGKPEPKHHIVMGLDPAGKGQDYSVLVAVCQTCRSLVDIWRDRRLPFSTLYEKVTRLVEKWQPASLCVDATGLGGQAIWEELEGKVLEVSRGTYCEDFVFTLRTKSELIMTCASRLEEGIAIPVRQETSPLMNELRAYEWDDKGLFTDCVMAFALAVKDIPPADSRLMAMAPSAVGERVMGGYERIDWERIGGQ